MTDNSSERCGSEDTTSGEACRNLASRSDGRCHVHTDVEGEGVDLEGRPSEIDKHYDEIMEAARRGLSYEGIARVAGVGRSTLDDRRRADEAFNAELERNRAIAEMRFVERAEQKHATFMLERAFGYTEEQQIEHTGDGIDLSLSKEQKEQLDQLFERDPQE